MTKQKDVNFECAFHVYFFSSFLCTTGDASPERLPLACHYPSINTTTRSPHSISRTGSNKMFSGNGRENPLQNWLQNPTNPNSCESLGNGKVTKKCQSVVTCIT